MKYNYIFILSAPRSGSTLLRVTLNKIPDIISPPETYFLEFYRNNKRLNPAITSERNLIGERWLQFRNHLNERDLYDRQKFLEVVKDRAKTWVDIFDILMELYAQEAGKALTAGMFICEKTPIHIEFQKELRELFPQAYIIFLIRDPRDVVASLKSVPWGHSSIIRNARYWNKTAQLIESTTKSVMVKYEDLVDNPDIEFEKISSLLNISLKSSSFESAALNEGKESVDPKNVASYKPIDKSFKDKWKTILSKPDHELEIIENICHEQMKQFGYEPLTKYSSKLSALIQARLWADKQFERIYRRIK